MKRRLTGNDWDIAITIATYLGTKPPSGSVGEVLYEALPAGPRSVQASSQ